MGAGTDLTVWGTVDLGSLRGVDPDYHSRGRCSWYRRSRHPSTARCRRPIRRPWRKVQSARLPCSGPLPLAAHCCGDTPPPPVPPLPPASAPLPTVRRLLFYFNGHCARAPARLSTWKFTWTGGHLVSAQPPAACPLFYGSGSFHACSEEKKVQGNENPTLYHSHRRRSQCD